MQYRNNESEYSDNRLSEIELDYKGLINGLEISFDFDPTRYLAGEQTEEGMSHQHEIFKRFMNEKALTIDMWDGDSLMHFGQCRIPLYLLLRQGEPFKVLDLQSDVAETVNAAKVGKL